jgi:hypothetical protein
MTPRQYGPLSDETRKKISDGLTGKHLSTETRAKLSAALIGKPRPPEIREKIRAGHKARGNSEQHLRRLHSVGGRTGVAGRLNRGRRWVTDLSATEERYLPPEEAADLVSTLRWRWGRRRCRAETRARMRAAALRRHSKSQDGEVETDPEPIPYEPRQ